MRRCALAALLVFGCRSPAPPPPLDGLHAGYLPPRKVLAEGGALDTTDLLPFLAMAREAAEGRRRLVITHSEVFPGTFASTTEATDWLLGALGMRRTPVLPCRSSCAERRRA